MARPTNAGGLDLGFGPSCRQKKGATHRPCAFGSLGIGPSESPLFWGTDPPAGCEAADGTGRDLTPHMADRAGPGGWHPGSIIRFVRMGLVQPWGRWTPKARLSALSVTPCLVYRSMHTHARARAMQPAITFIHGTQAQAHAQARTQASRVQFGQF